jgi:hypothetical protein
LNYHDQLQIAFQQFFSHFMKDWKTVSYGELKGGMVSKKELES